MNIIETSALAHSTIQSIYNEWDLILRDPPYQRNGEVWSLEKKQLLIDSIINRYDIPKIYFHKYSRAEAKKRKKEYAIIDGRQRLESIVKFIEGSFPLSEYFEYFEDPKVRAAGMTYNELAQKYPKIKSRFDAFSLPIITVQTDDIELIEDMFSRLNEAVPLNSAEKRRAIGGDLVKAIDAVSCHDFFQKKVRFNDKRLQKKEVAVRLLYVAHNLREDKIIDTKKPFLDSFTKDFKNGNTKYVKNLKDEVERLLDNITPIFLDRDVLLQAQASIVIYAFVFSMLQRKSLTHKFTRSKLDKFNKLRLDNRSKAELDISKANFDLLEFDRLSQQGTNDANSIRERWRILCSWLSSQR
ncbi:DUF262 domain-containing protein [Duganella sp. FT109W]|uniref:DUF262 domain-containing protein n=1 Tax=Duganella margarita TaxID=2692170 RepID=A0ABW9WNS5_9BURK|nr:DUF262 domain-containing protein [Duganella margarita]MYN42862.1 DUF262 domain-containing protein [Duganella margarita]